MAWFIPYSKPRVNWLKPEECFCSRQKRRSSDASDPLKQKSVRRKSLTPTILVETLWSKLESESRDLDPSNIEIPSQRAAELEGQSRADSLYRIPFAVKDNMDVAGCPTSAGCPDFSIRQKPMPIWSASAFCRVSLIGKTNMDQFATGLVEPGSTGYPAMPLTHSLFRVDQVQVPRWQLLRVGSFSLVPIPQVQGVPAS